jgi:DNA polymerase type B, organellar and viral
MARDYGYKILEVKSCVQFDKIDGLFEDYIKTIYNKKLQAEKENNDIHRFINKLLLNSLYGRLGIKGKNMNLKIIKETNIKKVLETENSDILFQSNDLYLIKSQGPLDPEILNIINKEKLYETVNNDFNANNP